MGLYDEVTLRDGPEGAQVKCWGRSMRDLREGATVGSLDGLEDYAVALREGGYAVVRGGALNAWAATIPGNLPVFDKWGAPFSGAGIFGADYLFELPGKDIKEKQA
ncbi:hypothetical protein LCGC14_2376430 [marine sediment metagenome]|uniref:Uncharacterized protein n=1 Tax=marine sediment metagenome TaxID=412755 RepID=A0A0F9CPH1_9ZZZZ